MNERTFFKIAGVVFAAQLAIWGGIGYVVYAILSHYNII